MGFWNRLFGHRASAGSDGHTVLQTEILDKLDALLDAGHYLAQCGDLDEAKFEALGDIARRAKLGLGEGLGEDLRKRMLAKSMSEMGGPKKLKDALAEDIGTATRDMLDLLKGTAAGPGGPLAPNVTKRLEKSLRRLQSMT